MRWSYEKIEKEVRVEGERERGWEDESGMRSHVVERKRGREEREEETKEVGGDGYSEVGGGDGYSEVGGGHAYCEVWVDMRTVRLGVDMGTVRSGWTWVL